MKASKTDNKQEKRIDLKKILAIIQKNFIVMTRDKVRIIPLLVFPLIMIMVFGFISGNTPKHISAAIVVYDNSPLSQEIQQEIANTPAFAVRHVVSTEGEGKKLLDSGKVKVIIEIPPNLEQDINNNLQSEITVIVDESDSSIGATSKQAMNVIVNKISSKISMQEITSFQTSVDSAAQKLQNYASNQINQYEIIASRTGTSETALSGSKKIIDAYAQILIDSIAAPTIYIPPSVVTNKYNTSDANTYISEAPGTSLIKSQVAILQQSSQLISFAAQNIHAATIVTKNADKKTKLMQDYQLINENLIMPISTIKVFTHSKAENILRPLVYEEKPAYGTGKRPIDFVIPAIIALTIFQGAVMGMGRAVAGEKREGSLTRVFLTPTSDATIIFGTLSFYVIFEVFRSAFIILISMLLFNVKIEGSLALIALILAIYASVSIAIGMIISSMVNTEQQFMAMAMLVSMPSMFLSGAFFPVQAMPTFMQALANFLPVTYGAEALRSVMIKGFQINMIIYPLFMLLIFLAFLIVALFMVFKRDIE